MVPRQPILTVRSMAEISRLSPARKERVLREQKYPKQEPQVFRTPYYMVPLAGIREYYRTGNDSAALTRARSKIQSIANSARRTNNKRVLDQFEHDARQYDRQLRPQSNIRYAAEVSTVHLKLSIDMKALEGKRDRFIYYNCKNASLGGVMAEDTLAIGYWLLQQNGINVPIDALEFVDLFASKVYRLREPRPSIAKSLQENARIIEELWPSI